MLDQAAERARRTYDAAADHYDGPALAFWSHAGTRTVERLRLPAGAAVLDAPCGTGASALPAARAVGPGGSVVGADVADEMLALARAKAHRAGLGNVQFRSGDMRALGFPDESFDAVVSVFGIFFVPDMPALAAELWRMVRPGGVLAVTTWGPDVLEPGAGAFWSAVETERPDLVRGFNPWDELTSPEQLLRLYESAGIPGARAELEEHEQPLDSPEEWWDVVLGTGLRGTVDQLDSEQAARVRYANLAAIGDVRAVHTAAVYGAAVKA